MKNVRVLLLLVVSVFVSTTESSCKRKVNRIDSNLATDISGRWNDTDSRLVSDAMINQSLESYWINEFKEEFNARPKVVVGLILNKSFEHIETETFIKDLERAFINSGRVRVVQAKEKRQEIREERASQKDFASSDTRKKWGKELGADFIIQGSISSIIDKYKKRKTVYYQIDLELTNIETNEKVWIGTKKIKKSVIR